MFKCLYHLFLSEDFKNTGVLILKLKPQTWNNVEAKSTFP